MKPPVVILLMGVFLSLACSHPQRLNAINHTAGIPQTEDISFEDSQNEDVNFTDSGVFSCPPDSFSYNQKHSSLFEDILDIYIAQEKIAAQSAFIDVYSNCWTDSTYVVIISHYQWGKAADSLVYFGANKIAKYQNITICFNMIQAAALFPIPNQLNIKTKKTDRRAKPGVLKPYNEYFNDIQIIFSPKQEVILDILDDGSERPILYRKLFEARGLM